MEQVKLCQYCNKPLYLTDDIGNRQWWECPRDNRVFCFKKEKSSTKEEWDANNFGRRIASSNCCRAEVLSKDKYGEWVYWCSKCGNPLEDSEMHKPTVGDSNYSSGHSIDVNGNCNMGCC